MAFAHKNKTFATLLASVFGSVGIHRFYFCGLKDKWGWLHLLSLPLSGLALWPATTHPTLFLISPLIISGLIAAIEALVIGLTPDEKWDAMHNATSAQQSNSGWPLAVLLVLTMGAGTVALIGMIARTFDLLYTGGAYG